jgi:hypothetical protein
LVAGSPWRAIVDSRKPQNGWCGDRNAGRFQEGLVGQARRGNDGVDCLAVVAVFDRMAVIVNERRADASRVRNLAGAIDCDLLPVAPLERPRLPGDFTSLTMPARSTRVTMHGVNPTYPA